VREDVEIPARPPRKRRQLERSLDLALAVWATSEQLNPGERRRVAAERERRKALAKAGRRAVVGVVWQREGRTPQQVEAVKDFRRTPDLHEHMMGTCDYREFVKRLDRLVALPKEMTKQDQPPEDSVWACVRYARHRGILVTVVLPNGENLSWQ